MRSPFIYSGGFKNRDAAADEMDDLFAAGEIDRCDCPRVISYKAKNGCTRWGVELQR